MQTPQTGCSKLPSVPCLILVSWGLGELGKYASLLLKHPIAMLPCLSEWDIIFFSGLDLYSPADDGDNND